MREIGFEIVDFRNFDSPLTMTLTLDDPEYYIVRFVSSTSIHCTIEHVASLSYIVNGRTDVRSYVHVRTGAVHFSRSGSFAEISPSEQRVKKQFSRVAPKV